MNIVSIQGNLIGRDKGGPVGVGVGVGGEMFTLTKTDVHAVALCLNAKGGAGRLDGESETGPINGPIDTDGTTAAVMHRSAVRRLMPVECERLQGFPDGYTAITYRGKPAADGPRYKALGNSWAVNCARWIGRRIAIVDTIRATERAAA